MRTLLKLATICFIGLGLSACSYTQDVLQSAYDAKADSDCGGQLGDQYNGVGSSCYNGRYDPNAASWDPNAILKKESDKGIKVEDVTPSE